MHIGQEIVAIIDHEQGAFKKGDAFIVKGLSKQCKCGLLVDVGMKDPCNYSGKILVCQQCRDIITDDGIWWFSAKRFVPINYNTAKIVTFKEIEEVVPMFSN